MMLSATKLPAMILGLGVLAGIPCEARPPADVDGARIAAADRDPANWLTPGRTYREERFSPLTQINDKTSASSGSRGISTSASTIGLEATPLVADGVMYTSGVWNILHAIDAKTGKALWSYDPQVPRYWMRYMCCGPANRGPALWQGKVFEGTIDGRLIAVDAATGKLAWSVQTTRHEQPYSITGAPRVVNGKVIIGNGGAEFGARGYVTAYDAETGKQVWRFYIVPGNPADGFESKTVEMAAKTWTRRVVEDTAAAATRGTASPTTPSWICSTSAPGNGAPWSRDLRSPGGGDNLFLSSIVAVRPGHGRVRVALPGSARRELGLHRRPADDAARTSTIDGKARKVILHAPKNGFFYVIDRTNGKLISANNFVPVNWASHIDLATGRPVELKQASSYDDQQASLVYPAHFGAHNWPPMSFSPITRLVYLPAQETSWPYTHAKELPPWQDELEHGVRVRTPNPPAEPAPPLKGYCSPGIR